MPGTITSAVAALCTLVFFGEACATASETEGQWPDTFVARLEALALLQTLNADLLSHPSATLTLERWCDTHHLASPAHIVAVQIKGADKVPTAAQRQDLHASATEPVRYRHVQLRCGTHVLSEADNWYLPSRLTQNMNHTLETSDTPFGRAVQELHFQRRTLSAELLWRPLPEGWESRPPETDPSHAALHIPPAVLEHRAVLTEPDGTPFSEVVETYTREVLGAPPATR